MGLLADRQIFSVIAEFQEVFSGERGGIVSIGSFSGLIATMYHANPSGHVALGVQMADVEFLDLSREIHPGGWGRNNREVSEPLDQIQIADRADVITDFVHVDGYKNIRPGTPAYLGPSGMVSILPDWGGSRVGTFMSSVGSQVMGLPEHETHQVLYMGGGLTFSVGTPYGTVVVTNPNFITAYTPGWVKLRVNIKGG